MEVIKNIKASELQYLNKGRTSTIFLLDETKIVKVFHDDIRILTIEQELNNSRLAWKLGIPTPKSYGMANVSGKRGIIYEYYRGYRTFEEVLRDNQDDFRRITKLFAESVKCLHVSVPDNAIQNVEDYLGTCCDLFAAAFGEEAAAVPRRLLDHMPKGDSFISMDCHPGNCFFDNETPVFFDLTYARRGSTAYDLYGMYAHYVFWPAKGAQRGISAAAGREIFDCYLTAYLGTDSAAIHREAERQIRCVYALIVVLSPMLHPGIFGREARAEAYDIIRDEADWFCNQEIIS